MLTSPPAPAPLYPSFVLDPVLAAANPNVIPSGTLALIPIDMTVTQMTKIIVTQVSLTQDFGLRGWVSQYPLGISLIVPLPDTFSLSRMTPAPLLIYVVDQIPLPDMILAPVLAGLYYLNILNLTNLPAVFAFFKTDLV
jgi:hypothetical protein